MSLCCLRQAVTELLKLAPPTAVLLTRNEAGVTVSEEEVAVELVQRGDLLKVDPADAPNCWGTASSFKLQICPFQYT